MRGRHGQGGEREELKKSRGPRDGIQTCELMRLRSCLLVARAWASGGKRNKRENQRGERAKLRVCTVGVLAPCVSSALDRFEQKATVHRGGGGPFKKKPEL